MTEVDLHKAFLALNLAYLVLFAFVVYGLLPFSTYLSLLLGVFFVTALSVDAPTDQDIVTK